VNQQCMRLTAINLSATQMLIHQASVAAPVRSACTSACARVHEVTRSPRLGEPAAASLRSARAKAHDSAASLDEVAMWEEDRGVSRYAADLPQLPEGLGRWGRRVRARQAATPGQPSLAAVAGSAAAP